MYKNMKHEQKLAQAKKTRVFKKITQKLITK